MIPPGAPQATISTRLLTRVVILLIAVWTLISGIVLVGFEGAGSGALGAGVSDRAAQRLLGAHLLVLAPAYLLIALRLEQYRDLVWLPFATQLAVVLFVAYSILRGDTDFGDGALAVAVGLIFAVLLAFVWLSEQRSRAQAEGGAEGAQASDGEATAADEL